MIPSYLTTASAGEPLHQPFREEHDELEQFLIPGTWPTGSVLCMEGQPAMGVFILRQGHAKESLVSSEGKTVILRILGGGDMIGLPETLSGSQCETTVESLEPIHADFVPADRFLRVLKNSDTLGLLVVRQLSRHCRNAYDGIRCLGLRNSIPERMADLILRWTTNPVFGQCRGEQSELHVFLTHEEIAQLIGCTRETVSRILAGFQRKRWIAIKGGAWRITNRRALEDVGRRNAA